MNIYHAPIITVSLESLEDEGLEKIPNLELAKKKYLLSLPEFKEDSQIKNELLNAITANNMAPWYEKCCKDLNWQVDEKLLVEMRSVNEEELKQLESCSVEAETSLNDSDLREACVKKAEYLSKIGDLEEALRVLEYAFSKTWSSMHRLKILFHCIRIGFFNVDYSVITKNMTKAEMLIDEGGDWDMRNRFKVYKGVYMMMIRKFKEASDFFLDTTSTFTSYEILDYNTFLRYAVLVSMVALSRNDLKEKIVRSSAICSVFHSNRDIKKFVCSLYDCQYSEFFLNLANVEQLLKKDFFLHPHYHYYVREMKIKGYAQLLESYRSLSLQYMADAFGVTVDYIDDDLSKFITVGRLPCKIDKVGGIVVNNRPDLKSAQFQAILKNGDLLLNRVQKLSRVINI